MVEYITRAELIDLAPPIIESAALLKSATSRSVANSTFLSHNSKDDDILPGVIRILTGHGATVYIDKIDTSLTYTTGRETANILKNRINSCKKFINLASTNSKDSKWVPWELGLADGYKGQRDVAIFPSVDSASDTAWAEREYLGIYDRIVWGELEGRAKPLWLVYNQEANSGTPLSDWLKR